MILVTGGAGFIGSNFVVGWLRGCDNLSEPVVNVDNLTYAGDLESLAAVRGDSRHTFVQADIGDERKMAELLTTFRPRAVINFAAESHVDRSIDSPSDFVRTNVLGTFSLLETVRRWWNGLDSEQRLAFRFIQVSTDEVYGSLERDDPSSVESHPFRPSSPYAATKAGADHLAMAWHRTYGLPTIVTHASNTYGPHQYPEKLIPRMIVSALHGRILPVYGDGMQVRDWLHVDDHCSAIQRVLEAGEPGARYNVSAGAERVNLELVELICRNLDDLRPRPDGRSYRAQITFVADRAGHDRRYSVDATSLRTTVGWEPRQTLESGLRSTVDWYLANPQWWHRHADARLVTASEAIPAAAGPMQ